MILRRLTQSLKAQNWTAIWIEFVLLVLGVFLGIQVSNWNATRIEQQKSAEFTQRLKSDLRVEAWNYEMQISYYGQVQRNAQRAADALSGHDPLSDEALLIAAYRATQYNANTHQRATYEELTSTGELGLINDPALRNLAMSVYTLSLFNLLEDEGRASQYRVAYRKLVPWRAQAVIETNCGDKITLTGDYTGIATTLDHPCHIDLPPAQIAETAATLRHDPELPGLLGLRIIDVGTNVANLTDYYEDMRKGLRAIAKETP